MQHIIGYQVQNHNGEQWAKRSSQEVLTENTALTDLQEAKEKRPGERWGLIAISCGDIREPSLEAPLSSTAEQYRVLMVSTAHLSKSDCVAIQKLAEDCKCNMIMGRDTGWYVKLFDDPTSNQDYEGMSENFHTLLRAVLAAGFMMIEFDSAAGIHSELGPTYDE